MSNLETVQTLMGRAEGTALSLAALRDGHHGFATEIPGFEELPPETQWALLVSETIPYGALTRKLSPDNVRAIIEIAEGAWDEMPKRRGLEGDVQAEVDARDEAIETGRLLDHEQGAYVLDEDGNWGA